MFNLSNKKFLVTGASGGIGQAIVNILHRFGATICISGTKLDVLHSITANRDIHVLSCDLSKNEEVKSLITQAEKMMSGIDGLVCNAGITLDKMFLRMSDEDWQKVIDVNLTSTFKLNREACKLMIKNKSAGRIINISSVVAMTGNAGQSNYSASKAAIIAMSKSIAKEVAKKNITVNCIAPGFIDTPMTSILSAEQKEAILASIPMQRMGTAEDVAAGVLFLASEESKYITGTTININGGLFMN